MLQRYLIKYDPRVLLYGHCLLDNKDIRLYFFFFFLLVYQHDKLNNFFHFLVGSTKLIIFLHLFTGYIFKADFQFSSKNDSNDTRITRPLYIMFASGQSVIRKVVLLGQTSRLQFEGLVFILR